MARPAPLPLFPPPGIMRGATPSASKGRWWDANLVRFRGVTPAPIGGWARYPDALLELPGRDCICWHDNSGKPWAVVGTKAKLWAYDFDLAELHDITPAGVGELEDAGAFVGYGLGTFGTGTFGTPRGAASVLPSVVSAVLGDMWSLDLWGQDLLIVPTQDGHLFRWSPLTPTDLPEIVPNAPTNIRGGVVVTDERHAVVYGADNDNRKVAWCDQEELEVWAPAVDNLAGTVQLETEGRPMNARRAAGGVLIWTDNDVHALTYAGAPFAYGRRKLAHNCGLLSRRAVSSSGAAAQWLSPQSVWQFDGSVSAVQTEVSDWMFSIINREQVGKIFGVPNSGFTEHWFFFPSEASNECDRYIALDYTNPAKVATIGQLSRTAGDYRAAMLRPIWCGPTGELYVHEYGYLADGESRYGTVYLESADVVAGEGERRFHVTGIEQDFVGPDDRLAFRFFLWERMDGPQRDTGTITIQNGSGKTDCKFSGRGVRIRIEQISDGPWALGRCKFMSRLGGKL